MVGHSRFRKIIMPLIESSSYRPPWWLPDGHSQTIVPALFRRVARVTLHAERLELEDGDFLDLEWSGMGAERLVILSHGLEASAGASYVQGMAGALVRRGWDALAWSFRGCGGTANRLPRLYHAGATEDLAAVLAHALRRHPAREVHLIGFSLGGNLTLKFLGEQGGRLSPRVRSAVAISVPCDLECAAETLARRSNRIYMERFLIGMRRKLLEKHRAFPGLIDLAGLHDVRTFREYDDRFTAPLHGFLNADDYWGKNSCKIYLSGIAIPTLLLNARNDPFLGPSCNPTGQAAVHDFLHLETPDAGGHVAFPFGRGGFESWAEVRATAFLEDC